MQKFDLDISMKRVIPLLYVKQRDVGTKVLVEITNNGDAYAIPAGASLSVWYSGASGEGNYTDIGENSAFSINENTVTVELIMQMLNKPGGGKMCLVMNGADGSQLGLWDIPYFVEAIPGADSEAAQVYYSAFQEHATKAVDAADRASAAAEALEGGLVLKKGEGVDSIVQVITNLPGQTELRNTPKALAECAIALGEYCEANAENAVAIGYDNKADGRGAFVEGMSNQADGIAAHAEGRNTIASGDYSHSEGMQTEASGKWAHVEGQYSKATGTHSHAENYMTEASGGYAHAEGRGTIASGTNSHAEGYGTTAKGTNTHAEGKDTIAAGVAAHAEGLGTKALCNYQHVQGKYNKGDYTQYAHIVGGGTSDADRKNIHTIDWDGNAMFAGTHITVGGQTLTEETIGDIATKAYLKSYIEEYIDNLGVAEGVAF